MIAYEQMGQSLDMLINADFVGRGAIQPIYSAALVFFKKPLTYLAAEKITRLVGQNDSVLIMTGFRTPPLFIQETDGPFGAASLARSIDIALGGKPILLTDPDQMSLKILESSARGAGLSVLPLERLINGNGNTHATSVLAFTIDEDEAREEANKLLDETQPKVIITVEKSGRNKKHIYHNQGGLDVSRFHSKVEYILEEGKKRKIPSIGIGDGGNEVGMGVVESTVRDLIEHGKICKCDCREGIAAEYKTDVLVTANVSNWGAYAVAGLIAKMTNKPKALHSSECEENMFLFSMIEGAIDGDRGVIEKSCDNMSIDIHQSILCLIRQILFHDPHPVASGKETSM